MDYILHLAITMSIWGILTLSLNYVAGFTGIISLSHATFYGIGAYSTAILTVKYGFSFLLSVAIGMFLAAVIAYIVSIPLLKLQEDAFILVSFGFAIIGYHVLLNWQSITNGALGIKGIKAPVIFGFSFSGKPFFLCLVLVALICTYFILYRIVKSPYGTIMKNIRENSIVASVNGHDVTAYKRSVYTVGALFAALAGSLMATFLMFIEPKSFELMISVFILIALILGGMGNLKGSILGAVFIILIPEILRFVGFPNTIIGEMQQITYGLILVLLMILRPQGLLGEYKI